MKFDAEQLEQIRLGEETGLDVSIYAKPEFDANQMYEVRLGLEKGLDVSIYAKPELDWRQMRLIRDDLEQGLNNLNIPKHSSLDSINKERSISIMGEKYLNESGKDVMASISISEEMMDKFQRAIAERAEELGLGEGAIDLVNFGNRTNPDLFLISDNVELGSISCMGEQFVVNFGAFADAKENLMEKQEMREDIAQFADSKEDIEEIMEMANGPEPEAGPQVEVEHEEEPEFESRININREDMAKAAFEKINEDLAAKGIDPKLNDKFQQQVLKDIAKEEKAEAKEAKVAAKAEKVQSRAEAKEELANLKEEIANLYMDLRQETSVAKMNGYNPENVARIESLGKEIADKTEKYAEKKAELPSIKNQTISIVNEKVSAVKDQLSKGFEKIKGALDEKINSGFNALERIKETVHDANEMFAAQKDSAYTNLVENVERTHRNWMAINHAVDNKIVGFYEKQIERLEKSFDKKAEIKGALKDLGRALTGKERTGEKAEYTPAQKEMLDLLKSRRDFFVGEMQNLEERFETSKAAAINNIKSAQEFRRDVGLDFSASLEKNMQKAQAESIAGKSGKTDTSKSADLKTRMDRC